MKERAVEVSSSQAATELDALIERVEAGENVILTLAGRPAVRMVPIMTPEARAARLALIEGIMARADASEDTSAQEFVAEDLYGEDGLPA